MPLGLHAPASRKGKLTWEVDEMMQEGCIKDEPIHLVAGASLGQGPGTCEFLVPLFFLG